MCDHQLDQGVMADPQVLGIPVLHTSPLLLVIKPSAKDKLAEQRTIKDYRLVAAFNQLNDNIQSVPAIRKDADHMFQILAGFKLIFCTDASDYFLQQWMRKSKWPYLGVQPPFNGKLVVTRGCQGLKGQSEHSDELIGKCLREMIEKTSCR